MKFNQQNLLNFFLKIVNSFQIDAFSRVGGNDVLEFTTSASLYGVCAEGERVYVRSDVDDNFVAEQGGRASSFNGFLVTEFGA